MPIRGSPNGACHPRPQAGRDRPEWVVAINRNAWSQSIGMAGRDHPVRANSRCVGAGTFCCALCIPVMARLLFIQLSSVAGFDLLDVADDVLAEPVDVGPSATTNAVPVGGENLSHD